MIENSPAASLSVTVPVPVSKRQQLLTKVLTALQAFILSKKLTNVEICLSNLAINEFTFFVTPIFGNFKVEKVEENKNEYELDFVKEMANKKVHKEPIIEKKKGQNQQMHSYQRKNQIEESSRSENQMSIQNMLEELEDEKERLEQKISVHKDKQKYLSEDGVLKKVLEIEFPIFRCAIHLAKIHNGYIALQADQQVYKLDKNILDQIANFAKTVKIESYKEIYELLGRYGYFLDKKSHPAKVVILTNDLAEKYQSSESRLFQERKYRIQQYGLEYFTRIAYPTLLCKSQICSWIDEKTLLIVVQYQKACEARSFPIDRFKVWTHAVKKYRMIEHTIHNYILELKKKIIKLKLTNRVVQFMKLNLIEQDDKDRRKQKYVLQFIFDFSESYKILIQSVRKELFFTNFKLDPRQYKLNFKNKLLRKYLQATFHCYITVDDTEVRCFILLNHSQAFMNFLKQTHMSHKFSQPVPEIQYWFTKLRPQLDQFSEQMGFRYEFQKSGIAVHCTSEPMFQTVRKAFDQLKNAINKEAIKVDKQHFAKVLIFVKKLASKYPSIQVQVKEYVEDSSIKPTKVINIRKVTIAIHQINSNTAISSCIDFEKYFADTDRTDFFHYFDNIDKTSRSTKEIIERILKSIASKQNNIKIRVFEPQYSYLYNIIKQIQQLYNESEESLAHRLTLGIHTDKPDILSATLQRQLKCEQLSPDNYIQIRGLSWQIEQIMKVYRHYYADQEYTGSMKRLSRDLQMDLKKFAIDTTCDVDFHGASYTINSADKMEVSQLLSKWLSFMSVR